MEAKEQILDRNIVESIKKNEGVRLTPYKDSEGVLTVGFGHTKNVVDKKITIDKALEFLQSDYEVAKEDARDIISDFDNLNFVLFGLLMYVLVKHPVNHSI